MKRLIVSLVVVVALCASNSAWAQMAAGLFPTAPDQLHKYTNWGAGGAQLDSTTFSLETRTTGTAGDTLLMDISRWDQRGALSAPVVAAYGIGHLWVSLGGGSVDSLGVRFQSGLQLLDGTTLWVPATAITWYTTGATTDRVFKIPVLADVDANGTNPFGSRLLRVILDAHTGSGYPSCKAYGTSLNMTPVN